MNPLNLVKIVTELFVSVGVGSIVGNTIKNATPENASRFKKISIGVGGFVLSSMISSKATKYATDQIDETVEKIKKFKNPEQTQDETKLN
jgi:hypothetical protein